MIRKLCVTAAVIAAAGVFSACASGTTATTKGGGPAMGQAQAEAYDGPKARLAVVKFIDKSAKGGPYIGSGMADMLVTELFRTNRFIMLDRPDLDAVVTEQDFGAAGRLSETTAAAFGELEGTDLLVIGAVTEFEKSHLGAGGLILGALTLGASLAIKAKNDDVPIGALLYKESHVAMDIKIVDAKTGRVVYANAVQGRYQNWGGGVLGAVGGGGARTPVLLGGFTGTGAERAIRAGVKAAVNDIVKNTPSEYYRVKEDEKVILASQLAAIYPVAFLNPIVASPDERTVMIVDGDERYTELLTHLNVKKEEAPTFDWEKTRLIAAFAGKQETVGHLIGVEKAIYHNDALEIQIAERAPPPPDPEAKEDKEQIEYGPDWPYDVVRIANPEKPIRIVWK